MSQKDSLIQHISGVPLFEGLSPQHLEYLANILSKRHYKRGQTIFSQGDEGVGFYVVISGRVKIFKISPDGKEQILHIFGAGAPFGEVPVFAGKQFPACAEAIEESQILFFPRDNIIDLIKKDPSFALNMLAVLSQRLKKFAGLIEDLSLKEVPGRLAAYLLYFSEQREGSNDLVLDISKGQLASLLGTIPETLSRILARMTKEGLIQSDAHRYIKLCDREGLEALSSGEKRLL
jgi:CRP/FNR family transcriptional regulator